MAARERLGYLASSATQHLGQARVLCFCVWPTVFAFQLDANREVVAAFSALPL